MKKLLGLLAVAPMAVAACGGEEAATTVKYDAVAYGSTHGAYDHSTSSETDTATGVTKAEVKLNEDGEITHLSINETFRVDNTDGTKDYVWGEAYNATNMDVWGFRILEATEATTAIEDFKHDVTWKMNSDYMDGAWTSSINALTQYLMGSDITAVTAKSDFLEAHVGDAGFDWTAGISGASVKFKHVYHYSKVVVEAVQTATDEAAA